MTGIHFTVVDSPGILKSILKVFVQNNIDLTHIKSKPSPFIDHEKKTEFYVDFRGSLDLPQAQATIRDLEKICA
jgi:prephenate dehydratase